jgi:hypothetical protein
MLPTQSHVAGRNDARRHAGNHVKPSCAGSKLEALPTVDANSGRAQLLVLLSEARRFHATHPGSPRRPRADLSDSSDSCDSDRSVDSASSGGLEPWDYLRRHVEYFWANDGGTPAQRYSTVKTWFTTLRLWDATLSWKDVEQTNNSGNNKKAQPSQRRSASAI